MPRSLDGLRARGLVKIVESLKGGCSFRNLLREAASEGVIKDNKTLRIYLDLLVAGNVLGVHSRDVGSVYRQQIYFLKTHTPKVWVGLDVLGRYGLNWDTLTTDRRLIPTDFDGLVRSRNFEGGRMASLEDCLVNEVCTDTKKNTGSTVLVAAMIATRKVDLPYLLRRADQKHVGKAMRILFTRIMEIASSNRTDLDAASFLAVRDVFLKIARQYSITGFWKMVDQVGKGNLGVSVLRALGEYDIVIPAAKQLGVVG